MKKYFFIDLSGGNGSNGRDYRAAGVVSYISDGIPNVSLKDYGVMYLDPFDVQIQRGWRGASEIELFECEEGSYEEYQYDQAFAKYEKIDGLA